MTVTRVIGGEPLEMQVPMQVDVQEHLKVLRAVNTFPYFTSKWIDLFRLQEKTGQTMTWGSVAIHAWEVSGATAVGVGRPRGENATVAFFYSTKSRALEARLRLPI
jgi:hypothetical protein